MRHLSPGQLVDLVEGAAPSDQVAHAASCEACRAQADALRDVLRQASSDTVPEPSPLFWEHLAARVGAAVRREPAPRRPRPIWTWRWASLTAAAVLVLAAGIGTAMWSGHPREPAVTEDPSVLAVAVAGPAAPGQDVASLDDPSWILMSLLSADVVFDDEFSAQLPAVPGLADRALRQLTESERAELARLLREEMDRRSAADPGTAGD